MTEPVQSSRLDFAPSFNHFSIGSRFLNEGEFRFDAKSYAEGAFRALHAIEACPYKKDFLGNLVSRAYHPTENQARSNFKRIWVKEGEGVPFLTGRGLFFLRPEKKHFLSPKMPKLEELMAPRWTVLLSRSGTTGRPVIVNHTLSQFALTDDAIRIIPNEVPIGYLYAFLSSSIGHTLITKNEYGATVSHLEAHHIKNIPIPLPPKEIQDQIHKGIIKAYELRDLANDFLANADNQLYDILGIEPFSERDIQYIGVPNEPRAYSVASSDLGYRLDASHHVPITKSAVEKLKRGRYSLVRLADRVDRVFVPPRFPRVYVESEYGPPLLQGMHIPLMRIYDLKCISNNNTPRIERWIIESGWVLVTCSGTVGRIAISTNNQHGWAASQHILRIIPRDNITHPGFVAAFLSTSYGQHQLKAKIYGGVVDELTHEDTKKVWIPDVPFSEQLKIGEPVSRAYELRDTANEIERLAIVKLENIILTKKPIYKKE